MAYLSNLLRSSGLHYRSAAYSSGAPSPAERGTAQAALEGEKVPIATRSSPIVHDAVSVPKFAAATAQPIEPEPRQAESGASSTHAQSTIHPEPPLAEKSWPAEHQLPDEPLAGVERLQVETVRADVKEAKRKPVKDQESQRESPPRSASPVRVFETASENPGIQKPVRQSVYLADVRRWLAEAQMVTSQTAREPDTPEKEITDAPQSGAWSGPDPQSRHSIEARESKVETEQAISNNAAEPSVENVTLSIGSIQVTVEEPATPPAASPVARRLVSPEGSDQTRLSRHYLSF